MTDPTGAPMDEPKDRRKQSVYLPNGTLEEIREMARSKDRSFSWLLREAWRIAKPALARLPDIPGNGAG